MNALSRLTHSRAGREERREKRWETRERINTERKQSENIKEPSAARKK